MSTDVQVDAEGLEARLRARAAEILLRNALALQKAHFAALSIANPYPHHTPAQRGEYPRYRTGFGRSQIAVIPIQPEEIARTLQIQVGVRMPAAYMYFLSRRGWKGLLDTYRAIKPQLLQMSNGGGGRTITSSTQSPT